MGTNSCYVREPTRKGDWGELARGRIHQSPSNIVRKSLRYFSLSHAKEWEPASGKEEQGPLSEVISLLAILFALPLLSPMFINIGPGTYFNALLSNTLCLMGGWRGGTTATELPSLSIRYPVVSYPRSFPAQLFRVQSMRTQATISPQEVSCDFLVVTARVSVIFLSHCY